MCGNLTEFRKSSVLESTVDREFFRRDLKLENPLVLVHEKKISSAESLIRLLELSIQTSRLLLIVQIWRRQSCITWLIRRTFYNTKSEMMVELMDDKIGSFF